MLRERAILFRFKVERRARDATGHHRQRDGCCGGNAHAVTPHKAAHQIRAARRTRRDRLESQVARDVIRQIVRAAVAPRRITLECLQHDPVHVRGQIRSVCGGLRRVALRQIAQEDVDGLGGDVRRRDERLSAHQFKQDGAQRIHIAARVHMAATVLDLLRADVARCAHELVHARKLRLRDVAALQHLRDAEVDHLRRDLPRLVAHHDVGGLQIAVDDPFLMRVMHRLANRHEELQPLPHIQFVLIAVSRDRAAFHQLHHEIGHAALRFARVEHARDVGMLHQRQRLPLRGETAKNDRAVQPGLQQFDRHQALDRLHLLCAVNDAESALAQFVQQAVAIADPAVLAACSAQRAFFAAHRCHRRRRVHRGGRKLAARIRHRDRRHVRRSLDRLRVRRRQASHRLLRQLRHHSGHAPDLIERSLRREVGGIRLHEWKKRPMRPVVAGFSPKSCGTATR